MKLRFMSGFRIVPVNAPARAVESTQTLIQRLTSGVGAGVSFSEGERIVTRNGPLSRNDGFKNA
jgi:hypothetical protein